VRILLGLIFCAALVSAQVQTPDEITREPHHRLLLQNEQVRVFEVMLRPSERLFVKHQYNFLVVTLLDSEVVMWNEGESEIANFRFNRGDVRFFYGGAARGMRNDHNGVYRNITVEFLNPKVTTFGYQPNTGRWQYGGSAIGPPVDPNKKFRSTLKLGIVDANDVQLLQRDTLEPPDKGTLELLIPVTDLDMTNGSDLHVRKSAGDAWWIGDRRKADLMNTSPDPARFALVELKPAQQ